MNKEIVYEKWHPNINYTPHPNSWNYSDLGGTINTQVTIYGVRDILDVRGWGYLTGKGHAALGLPHETAQAEQDALGQFVLEACQKHALSQQKEPLSFDRKAIEFALTSISPREFLETYISGDLIALNTRWPRFNND